MAKKDRKGYRFLSNEGTASLFGIVWESGEVLKTLQFVSM